MTSLSDGPTLQSARDRASHPLRTHARGPGRTGGRDGSIHFRCERCVGLGTVTGENAGGHLAATRSHQESRQGARNPHRHRAPSIPESVRVNRGNRAITPHREETRIRALHSPITPNLFRWSSTRPPVRGQKTTVTAILNLGISTCGQICQYSAKRKRNKC